MDGWMGGDGGVGVKGLEIVWVGSLYLSLRPQAHTTQPPDWTVEKGFIFRFFSCGLKR